MRALSIALLLMAAGQATAAKPRVAPPPAPPRIEQRQPTGEERASFDDYYRQKMLAESKGAPVVQPLFAPEFDIERQRGKPWQVIARVDSAPRHSAVDLCRQIRSSFIYDAKAPRDARWSESAQAPSWHVWLAQPRTICTAAPHTVLMDPALPPEDVVALLRQYPELLSRARLLLAGNSQCIRQRALPFTLRAIEPAPPAAGAPVMFNLVFESDRDTTARVAVRKHRGEYAAWNVNCD
ncbi:hypothetical protein D0T25_15290 [Duganella sp. BJB488]|uniref:hypothetical protein n=1 Tax=unclassified Duganella TaxID=2636909 RepID=UPI000E343B49|nr:MULTISPECIES: hypothetical protein [unclassified Duganella]RFP20314.1 hypothetical protein D0T26_13685 [Duganella sp. BJB489]RFP21240.1 hypothetical protein D0T25_15290 [Duganella sp. BJB488]RFP33382.1 hypothetical protein D0T24_18985 [Duganella sp. BJB480]